MSTLFRNNSPGALTLNQAHAREKKRVAALREAEAQDRAEKANDFKFPEGGILGGFNPAQARKAHQVAAQGRGSDTEIAHVARGELVVPRALQNREVLAALSRAAAAHNIPLGMLTVGNVRNSINPATGAPEFGSSDIFSLKDNTHMSGAVRGAIKGDEGYKPKPYPDIAGNITSGFGHKGTLTRPAEDQFNIDVTTAEDAVNRSVKVPITQAERDAMGSLAYNIGANAFAESTIPALLNAGQYIEAANAFSLFNKFTNPVTNQKEVSNGLALRRQRERDQFLDHTLIVRAPRLP